MLESGRMWERARDWQCAGLGGREPSRKVTDPVDWKVKDVDTKMRNNLWKETYYSSLFSFLQADTFSWSLNDIFVTFFDQDTKRHSTSAPFSTMNHLQLVWESGVIHLLKLYVTVWQTVTDRKMLDRQFYSQIADSWYWSLNSVQF